MINEELKKHLTSLDKDTLISLYLQKCFDTNVEKVEFAVAELEKAQKNIIKNIYAKSTYGGVEHFVSSYIIKKLDQQIKELKNQ